MGTKHHNNFDLLRLLAALQVIYSHAWDHFPGLHNNPFAIHLHTVVGAFPGVPIFFVISGFLIAESFARNHRAVDRYAWFRFLRIYPALWGCLVVSVLSAVAVGYLPWSTFGAGRFWVWIAAQVSFLQYYNLADFRGYGVGVLNGSLWTIPIELQFYALIPLLALPWTRLGVIERIWRRGAVAAALSFGAYLYFHSQHEAAVAAGTARENGIAYRVLETSVLGYFWYFFLGVTLCRFYRNVESWLTGRGLLWLAGYGGVYFAVGQLLSATLPFTLPGWLAALLHGAATLLLAAALAGCTVALAFTRRELAWKLLRGHDFSYGVYLYHIPVINALLYKMPDLAWAGLALTYGLTVMLAMGSWFVIERPALGLRQKFTRVQPAPAT